MQPLLPGFNYSNYSVAARTDPVQGMTVRAYKVSSNKSRVIFYTASGHVTFQWSEIFAFMCNPGNQSCESPDERGDALMRHIHSTPPIYRFVKHYGRTQLWSLSEDRFCGEIDYDQSGRAKLKKAGKKVRSA